MGKLKGIIESILFVAGDPVDVKDLRERLNAPDAEVSAAIRELSEKYSGESGITLLRFNGKLQLSSNKEYADAVSDVLNPVREKELTKAMLETLAIIAYKQPVTRGEIEEIRGVDCAYAVQNLSKLAMIAPVGRKDAIGRPMLFGTTDVFLRHFSLGSIGELPEYEELLCRLDSLNSDRSGKSLFSFIDDGELPDFLVGEKLNEYK